ncbi:hypothetical protein [Stieleria marina]
MDCGDLASGSTIRWRSSSAGAIEHLISGGTKLGETKPGFGYRLAAHYCHSCRLLKVQA